MSKTKTKIIDKEKCDNLMKEITEHISKVDFLNQKLNTQIIKKMKNFLLITIIVNIIQNHK